MIKVAQEDETVIIECTDSHARLRIIETAFASIKGLHFNGCGYNILIRVIQFKLEDTIFAGAEDRGRALELRMVTAATIVNCTFIHCNEFITYGYGAAIFATQSSFNITNSIFTNNNAIQAGALAITDSFFNIISSTFADNSADFYGAIYVVASSFNIINSTFTSNSADSIGAIFCICILVQCHQHHIYKQQCINSVWWGHGHF